MSVKSVATNVGLTVAGILAAGFILYSFSDVDIVMKARKGFTGAA